MSLPKAIIFDMDGLMFDTERLGLDAWEYVGKAIGLNITREIALKAVGVSWESSREIFFHELGEFDFCYGHTLFQQYINSYIEEHGMPVKAGLMELLAFLDELKMKKAIATGSQYNGAVYYLEKAGISGSFGEIVTAEMVAEGKPAPDIFLHTAKLLGVVPQDCWVLEDSIKGIKAAVAANMKPIMIPDLVLPNNEIASFLFARLASLTDVIELLKKWA